MFRAFILKASEGRSAPDFSTKSLAGAGGRMDLVCRCIIAALRTPKGPNPECRITVVLEGPPDPPASVRFEGSLMERAPEGELEAAELLAEAMRGEEMAGIRASRDGFGSVVRAHAKEGLPVHYLHEGGEDFSRASFGERAAFVLGDHKGIDPQGERLLDAIGARRISLGPHAYLASHCITIINGLLP